MRDTFAILMRAQPGILEKRGLIPVPLPKMGPNVSPRNKIEKRRPTCDLILYIASIA